MPDYKIVARTCVIRNRQVRCPATYEADSRCCGGFGEHINDCFGKDPECKKSDCKYSGGAKDPFVK